MIESQIQSEFCPVSDLMREISHISDPQQLLRTYKTRARDLHPTDRTVSLSRRDLEPPYYRITRSDLWTRDINPWKHRDQLPLLRGGLLGELLYAGMPRIIDRLTVAPDDPAAEQFTGMGSLAAIPHFDNSVALNMVVHFRREPDAFDHARFPDLVLLSGLFGRAMKGLVLAADLRDAKNRLQEQYHAVTELTDTVIEQARTLKVHSELLEERVRERTAELEAAHLDTIYMLAAAGEAKDEDTGNHVRRLQDLSYRLARTSGQSETDSRTIARASILHDIGKIHVPDSILKKAGPLTADERAVMQGHTLAGERILAAQNYFAPARRIARSHHENWDGTGYPDGLAAAAIPREAHIVHLVDVYDALTHVRTYKAAWTLRHKLDYIRSQESRMFDPDLVKAFVVMPTVEPTI